MALRLAQWRQRRQFDSQMANESTEGTSQTAFERVKLARHPERPYTLDFIERMFEGFNEIHGDRRFADDPAVVCGFALSRMPLIGHQGATRSNAFRNFGCKLKVTQGHARSETRFREIRSADFSFIDTRLSPVSRWKRARGQVYFQPSR